MTPIRIVLLLALAGLLALPASASAGRGQFTIFEAPRELSSPDAGVRGQAMDEIQALGARWVRVLLYWNNVAPARNSKRPPAGFDESNPDSRYDWSQYDRVISEANARGLRVIVTITGPVPRWATAKRRGHTFKPSPVRFGKFVTAVGRRYGGTIDRWSIWNEPNHPQFLRPQYRKRRAYSPVIYRALYGAALKGLRASGNGRDHVMAGETAPRGTPRVVAPVTFARKFFRGRNPKVSGWAHHPYTTRSGPFFRPPDRTDVTIGVLSRLTRALDRKTKRRLPLYLTEFGIQSKPDPYVGVTETRQAEYRSIAERIAYRNRRVKAFSQYMLRDDLPREGSPYARYSGFESGIRHSNGEPKLSYDGFRLPLVADRSGRRVTLWGLVRPATGPTQVEVQYRNRGSRKWRRLKSDATNRRGYWTTRTRYRKGRSYRVTWNGFTGPRTRVYR